MATDHETWLTLTQEEALDPDLPICDPHHHLWDYPNNRYLLEELLQDLGGGHRVTQTVFVECVSHVPQRRSRRDEVGSGRPSLCRALPPRVPVEIMGRQRLPPALSVWLTSLSVRRSNRSSKRIWRPAATGFAGFGMLQAGMRTRKSGTRIRIPPEGLLLDATFRQGFACLHKLGLSFDAWMYHTQLADLVGFGPRIPGCNHHPGSYWRTARYWSV